MTAMSAGMNSARQDGKAYSCELVVRLPRVAEAQGPRMKTGRDFWELCKDLEDLDRESFHVVTLTQKNAVIERHLVELGTLTGALVHPREVFRPALHDNAAAVAFLHNTRRAIPNRARTTSN